MKLRVIPAAELEARQAGDRYERHVPGMRAEFLAALGTGLHEIEQHSTRFPSSAGGGERRDIRRLLLKRFPYKIIYEVLSTEVVVLCIAHGRRKPGYWRRRTP